MMFWNLFHSVVVLTSVFFSSVVLAANYYVSPLGNDENSGVSEEEPFQRVQHAVDSMESGDTLVILDGVYTGRLKLKSGITIKAKNPRKAIFSGAEPLSGEFKKHAGGVYRIKTDIHPKQVFYKGKPMTWARWPNITWAENWVRPKKWINGGARPGELRASEFSQIKKLNLNGAYVFLRYAKGNSCYSRAIESFDGTLLKWEDKNFYNRLFTGEDGKHGSPVMFREGKGGVRGMFFLAGDVDLIDSPGEWFEQDGMLYFQAPGAVRPVAKDFLVKTHDYALFEEGPITDLKIEGIDFFATSVKMTNPGNERILFEDAHFTYIGAELLFPDKLKGKALTKPIHVSGNRIGFNRCLFAGGQNGGLQLGGSMLVVQNSVFAENNRHANFEGTGLFLVPSGTFKIKHNTFFNNCSDAVRITFNQNYERTTPPEMAYNNICNAGTYNPDVSGTYFPKMTQNWTMFHHNWVHHVQGNGVRLDQAGEEFIVHHNVFWANKRGMSIEGFGKFNVYNNTSVLNKESCDLIRNVVPKTKGYNPDMVSHDTTFPPIDDWLVMNNLIARFSDNVGPSELGPFEKSKKEGKLHPERAKRRSFPVKDRGTVRGNMTGFKNDIFVNGKLGGLNLIPAQVKVRGGVAPTSALKSQGVLHLGNYRGAFDYRAKPWVAGSNWMPYGLKAPKTMAEANAFAQKFKFVSLVPNVRLDGLPRGTLDSAVDEIEN